MHVEVNGTRLWFDIEGPLLIPEGPKMHERPTVVLLHGGPGGFDHSYLKPDFQRLTRGAQVVYLDVRGHGRSDRGDPADWNFELVADDVRAFCDTLGIRKPVVFGHSLGGCFAMLYGIRHPGHAGALILQSTYAFFDLPRIVEEFRRVGGDEIADIAERDQGGGSVTKEEWAHYWNSFGPWVPGEEEFARIVANRELGPRGTELYLKFDVRDALGKVDAPTLVCVGELDPITSVAIAQEIADALPRELVQLEIIEGAGHFPWKDKPNQYWRVLETFVATVTPDSSRTAVGT